MDFSRPEHPRTIVGIIPQYPIHSQNNIYARVKMPPLGIISVLSQFSANPELHVYAVDENNYGGPLSPSGQPDHGVLQQRNPAHLAMFYGGMSNAIPRLFQLARQYRGFGAITIAGGSHVDALPEEALNSGVDVVVHGEGEDTALELLDILDTCGPMSDSQRERLHGVKGISFLDSGGRVVFTGKRQPIRELDLLRIPDLTLIRHLKKRWTAIPIHRGRGCNFKCEFCVVNKQYGAYKSTSSKTVLDQIIRYSDLGYHRFFFTDDNFAQDPNQTIALCKEIGDYRRQFQRKIQLMVQVRTEVAKSPDLVEAMRYAGVRILAIGFESPINEELKRMKKGVTVEMLTRRTRILSQHFYIHGMFIFAYPSFHDDPASPVQSLASRARAYWRFFKNTQLDSIQVLNAVPLPGSRLRERLEAENRLFPLSQVGWDKYDGMFLCYDSTPEGLRTDELQRLPRTLMGRRYLGSQLNRRLNYGHWMAWIYLSTLGFLVEFPFAMARRLTEHMTRKTTKKTSLNLLPKRGPLTDSLIFAWNRIKKRWRTLAIRTYAGGIYRRWSRHYRREKAHHRLLRESTLAGLGERSGTARL